MLSTRTTATGGAFGLFDPESALNPAALGGVGAVTASFKGVQSFRTVENPAGVRVGARLALSPCRVLGAGAQLRGRWD